MACKNHPQVTEQLSSCSRCGQSFCPNCLVQLQGQPYCAGCKSERVRDVQSGVGSGGAGGLELAGVLHRFGAQFIDGLIVGVPVVVIFLVLFIGVMGASFSDPEAMQQAMQGGAFMMLQVVGTVFALAVGIVYEGYMLASRGQTLGKMALGIKVVTPEGHPIQPGQAWTRAAVRQGLGLLSCCGMAVDLLPIFFTEEKTAVHDMAAKTRVVFAR